MATTTRTAPVSTDQALAANYRAVCAALTAFAAAFGYRAEDQNAIMLKLGASVADLEIMRQFLAAHEPRGRRRMSAVTGRRSETEELRAEVAGLRAENAELWQTLRAVAHLLLGAAVTCQPRSEMAAPARDVRGICQLYGVPHQAPAIQHLFERRP